MTATTRMTRWWAAPAVAFLLTGCMPMMMGGGGGEGTTQANSVTISGFQFRPADITVKAGTTVTWTNMDSAPHTATAQDGSFNSGTLARGQSYTHTFMTPGTYPYSCALHPNMKATVRVTAP